MQSPEDAEKQQRPTVDALLFEVLERLTAGEHEVVEQLCAEHPEFADELRERVDVLRDMQLLPSDSAAMAFPERLGEFRLVRRLGGGGMGVVYEAVQEPLGRTVALKLIRPEHLYFEKSRERFKRETEAVARLAHPGIVTIHTVGEAQGAPYFAMEMIAGATLDQALEQVAGLPPASLLGGDLRAAIAAAGPPDADGGGEHIDELFSGSWSDACTRIALRMTEALSHAHQRGVLHRDIKPSNIAVTLSGRVVLLDFGLAALDDNLRLTGAGSTLGSVLYMSPEQLAGRADEIDERTDVYALGVTLYELLALEAPYARADSTQTRAAILEGQAPPLRARHQGVPRDLEIVCLHAMEHDRARRYPSMDAFASDLRAVLEGRPISARPPSAAYRVRRWMTRHPATSTAIALGALLVIVLPTALYLQQRANSRSLQGLLDSEREARTLAAEAGRRAKLEADEAEQVASFLVELFAASDPYSAGRRDLSAADVLDHGVMRVERELSGQPELQARLLERIGESYNNLDLYAQALTPLDRALELRRELHGEDDVRTANAKMLVASAARLAGRAGSEAMLRSAVATLEKAGEEHHAARVSAWSLLAMYRTDAGDAREALELLSRARSEIRDEHDLSRAQRWMILAMTASAEWRLGQAEDAERTARAALALDQEIASEGNPWRVAAMGALAMALADQGEIEEAQQTFSELLPQALAFYGEDNAVYAGMLLDYAGFLQDQGQNEGLAERLESVQEILVARLGADHARAITAVDRRAHALSLEGRYDEACAVLRETLDAIELRAGPDSPRSTAPLFRLGVVQLAMGAGEEACATLRQAGQRTDRSDESSSAADLQLAAALLETPSGNEEAGRLATAWLDRGPTVTRAMACYVLGRIALDAGELDVASSRFEDGVSLTRASARTNWIEHTCRLRLAELRLHSGERGEACEQWNAALRDMRRALGPQHLEVRNAGSRGRAFSSDCAR